MFWRTTARLSASKNGLLQVTLAFVTALGACADANDVLNSNGMLWPGGKPPKLTTSRVVGSPEPPLPYTSERVYPNLKLSHPICLVQQPGSDRLWTITNDGADGKSIIRRFVDQPDVSETEVLLPADGRLAYDVAFHPQFVQNGFVYVGQDLLVKNPDREALAKSKAEGDKPYKGDRYVRVSRFKVNPLPPYEFDPKSETTIIEWLSDGHNGAAVAFGLDGLLFVTSGDGTSDSDTNLRGQEMTELTAKVLRIDVDHPQPGKQYSVPTDNPFVGKPNIAPETWAFGLRNPWRMTVDRETGHLWVGNNGQDLWEQIFFVRKGDNYGWSVYEGSHPFYLNRTLGPAPHVKPMLEHHHTEARSLTGGIVYYGTERPELRGAYIYGDYSTGKIWAAKHDGANLLWHKELTDTPFHLTCFATNARGQLLFSDYLKDEQGAFYRLIPNPIQETTSSFPKTLTESGLFREVAGHVVHPALVPYSVNSPLWSDGAEKVRYIAIPGEEPKIEIKDKRGWNFPNETVLVKSFSLDLTTGDPKSKRWIETRFLTKQQNEWAGYSYRWNDEQTEATLVSKEGLDAYFTIQTAEGPRQQKWRFPGRTECMVCHSRAANFVLGLSTGQMNRDWHGDHVEANGSNAANNNNSTATSLAKENQLTMLERFGFLTLSQKPEELERLANPYDASQSLDSRAKSYLHANCAICHVDAGGGNAQMQLEFSTPLEKMKIVDAVPVHDRFNLPDARLISPGHPESSVLLHRIAKRGRGQMPQLATSRVDKPAIEMMTEWIKQLKSPDTNIVK